MMAVSDHENDAVDLEEDVTICPMCRSTESLTILSTLLHTLLHYLYCPMVIAWSCGQQFSM